MRRICKREADGLAAGHEKHRRQDRRYHLILLFVLTLPLFAEPADWTWSARYVVTMDSQRQVVENGAIAIRGDRIVGVGRKADIDARFQPKQRLDRPDAILAPGLINT